MGDLTTIIGISPTHVQGQVQYGGNTLAATVPMSDILNGIESLARANGGRQNSNSNTQVTLALCSIIFAKNRRSSAPQAGTNSIGAFLNGNANETNPNAGTPQGNVKKEHLSSIQGGILS